MKNKMKAVAFVLCIIMLACFSGCNKNQGATESTTAAPVTTAPTEATTAVTEATTAAENEEGTAYEFSIIGLSETLYLEEEDGKEGTVVLCEADINFPHIEGDNENIMNINSFYENVLEEQTIFFREEFYLMANDSYEFARENESEYIEYFMHSDFWVACNDEKLFSVVRSHSEYDGGNSAHTTLASETFDKETGSIVELSQLFSVEQSEYKDRLVKIMVEQAKEKTDLFENYDQLIAETFVERDFYIHKDEQTGEMFLVVYYQPYSIAPNSTGIVDFFINMEEIADILK
ncbi:MAG: DUF3298 and DUF4163 domain-containing protein [Ruminococcaceae bacterium]|nr:DUF3298 and DUF4163 domain-containing protein [Oscillospiraceae bacterium]